MKPSVFFIAFGLLAVSAQADENDALVVQSRARWERSTHGEML